MKRAHKPRLRGATGGVFGLSQSFATGDEAAVEEALTDAGSVRAEHLRTVIDLDGWQNPVQRDWIRSLVPTLAGRCDLLPCLVGHGDSLPTRVAEFIAALGAHFTAVELELDGPELAAAVRTLHDAGKTVALRVSAPADLPALPLDALTVRLYPDNRPGWPGWAAGLERVARTGLPVWLTTGATTWGHRTRAQLAAFLAAHQAPAARVYWQAGRDQPDVGGDPRLGDYGLRTATGETKLLLRLLSAGGVEKVRETYQATRRPRVAEPGTVLVTGGAGFVGANLADRLAGTGRRVVLMDNLSRPGTEQNLRWLLERHPERVEFRLDDVRNPQAVEQAVAEAESVFHFAAQVAVTTSLDTPLEDFERNARGTLNLLEAIRRRTTPPRLLFTSTNKVYGGLDDIPLAPTDHHYEPEDPAVRHSGINEGRPLEFCSPYGCSKGAADQYVLDYARTFGLPATVFRMSCIYGPRQFGNEDQGWVAHFLIQALRNRPIVIYGDGLQVRDVLYVEDLVDAMLAAERDMPAIAGQAFNIGGGPANTLSLRQLLVTIEQLQGGPAQVEYQGWRASDQRWYCSDTTKFTAATGWAPRTAVADGVRRLHRWLAAQYGIRPGRQRRAAL